MLISHEIPKQLFSYSGLFNDYPYVLGHLLKLDPEYKKYYVEELKKASFSILDNSAFELGKSIDFHELNTAIRELKPTHYILPDTVHDQKATLESSKSFLDKFGGMLSRNEKVTPIGVLQGDTFGELHECALKYLQWGVAYLAIPFDCIKDSDWATIRFQFFTWLLKNYTFDRSIKFHFLGLQNPQEMLLYTPEQLKIITSIDSSSPIIHGWCGNEFTDYGVASEKPKIKLADNLNISLQDHQVRSIAHNIKKFRSYVER